MSDYKKYFIEAIVLLGMGRWIVATAFASLFVYAESITLIAGSVIVIAIILIIDDTYLEAREYAKKQCDNDEYLKQFITPILLD